MGYRTRLWRVEFHAIVFLLCVIAYAGLADAATSFSDGARVDVREGDSWSGASVLKHEGRKYLVHYEGADASTDEWVTADRMRLPGSAPSTNPASSPQTLPAARAAATWNIGQKPEVKWGVTWYKAVIVNKRGEWYLINYENWPTREWVEPWRLRKPGSAEDTIGYAKPNPTVNKGDGPPTEKPGTPPEPVTVAGAGRIHAAEAMPASDVTAADRSGMKVVNVTAGLQSAGFEPDAAEKLAKRVSKRSVSLKPCSFFESITGCMLPTPGTTTAALIRTDRDPTRSVPLRVERVDLNDGRSIGSFKLPPKNQFLDYQEEGALIATRSDVLGIQDGRSRLDIWQFDASEEVKHLISFVPMDGLEGFREVDSARFIDRDHLLVHGFWGKLSLWEFRKARCIWSMEAKDIHGVGAGFGISANRKYLAVFVLDRITVADMLTGRPMISLSAHGGIISSLSFNPEGNLLAAAGPDLLMVWDLKSDKLQYDLSPVGAAGSSIDWPADGYVLLDHQKLVSLAKQLVVWTYTMQDGRPSDKTGMFAGRFWFLVSDIGRKNLALCSATIPDEAAVRAAASVDVDAQMVVHPGMRVSLEVNVPADARELVIASLTAKLKDNGITIADGEPIKLVAQIEPGESHAMKYGSMMERDRNPTTISVQDIKGRLAFESSGKVLWERKAVTTAPPSLWLKQGETVQQAIADAMKPPVGLFESGRIPQYVPKNPNGFGSSVLGSTETAAAKSH